MRRARQRFDNSAICLKTEIRNKAIGLLGGESKCMVLDLFAGSGEMRDSCYSGVAEYLGVDKKYSRNDCIKADNKVVLPYVLGLRKWNLFDLDAYGNPFDLAEEIVNVSSSAFFQVVLTDGISQGLAISCASRSIKNLMGWKFDQDPGSLVGRLRNSHDEIVSRYVSRWKCKVLDWECYKHKRTARGARYYRFSCAKGNSLGEDS